MRIKDIAKKPSDLANAMVIGLLRQNTRTDFRIDMDTYGKTSYDSEVCFGCAATSCLQQVSNVNYTAQRIGQGRADSEYWLKDVYGLQFDYLDVREVEIVVNNLRLGYIKKLLRYYDVEEKFDDFSEFSGDWYMETFDWCCQLPKVIKFIHALRKAGL